MEHYKTLKNRMLNQLMKQMDYSREIDDEEIKNQIDEMICHEKQIGRLSLEDRKRLQKEIFYAVRKLDILQELIEDKEVTEIMINGPNHIFVEKEGKLIKWPWTFESKEKLQDIIQHIVADCNRVVNEASPIVDARLENGSRVNVVMNPIALNGPIVTIRRFPEKPMNMQDLLNYGSISEEAAGYLKKLVQARYNIFISGGTGSGKTTFLNVLSGFIPTDERIISIEDSAELQIQNIDNLVRLETRNSNVEGCIPISIRDLIKTALRMRPDRVIIGEVRGAEAIDMLQAMNTGHDGSISTGHANSAGDMLSRLETMVLMGVDLPLAAIKQQIASGIDILVHLGRLRDNSRKVLQILEISGLEGGEIKTRVLFEFVEKGEERNGKVKGSLEKRESLGNTEKLKCAGIFL